MTFLRLPRIGIAPVHIQVAPFLTLGLDLGAGALEPDVEVELRWVSAPRSSGPQPHAQSAPDTTNTFTETPP